MPKKPEKRMSSKSTLRKPTLDERIRMAKAGTLPRFSLAKRKPRISPRKQATPRSK